jgi:hypothetical protein
MRVSDNWLDDYARTSGRDGVDLPTVEIRGKFNRFPWEDADGGVSEDSGVPKTPVSTLRQAADEKGKPLVFLAMRGGRPARHTTPLPRMQTTSSNKRRTILRPEVRRSRAKKAAP